MSDSFLKKQIMIIQSQYCELLEIIRDRVYDESIDLLVNEIQQFWQINKRLINCYMHFETGKYTTYIFTGAVILDIADKEHFPFMLIGKQHIWDDPICEYFVINKAPVTDDYRKKISKQIERTINDNIQIIRYFNDTILVLPLRYLNKNRELAYQTADQLFFSLFNSPITKEEYFIRFDTIEYIQLAMRKEILE